jgi:putative membrane protein
MIRNTFQRLALIFFCIYLAVLPGSTIVVALDRVPSGGAWMGGALLLLQGGAALGWLVARHGARGGLAALLVFLLAWAVEHIGVTTGMPFGQYAYTSALQPQLLGIVPLAIPCAWLMVATGAWQLTTNRKPRTENQEPENREPRTENRYSPDYH